MTKARKPRKTSDRPSVAVLYVRVSTGQQAESGLSLEQQERTLRLAAESAGYSETVTVREEGISGKSLRNRPALNQALDLLATGQAAALYVSKLDRLARSTRDTLHVVDTADAQGWRLVALDVNLDTATPVGRLVLTILAAVAEMERQRIAERHRDWHSAKRSRGLVWGVDEGPRSNLADSTRSRIVSERESGKTLQQIADGLNADGIATTRGNQWRTSSIAAVLNSPRSVAA